MSDFLPSSTVWNNTQETVGQYLTERHTFGERNMYKYSFLCTVLNFKDHKENLEHYIVFTVMMWDSRNGGEDLFTFVCGKITL